VIDLTVSQREEPISLLEYVSVRHVQGRTVFIIFATSPAMKGQGGLMRVAQFHWEVIHDGTRVRAVSDYNYRDSLINLQLGQ
jgi:hypothetical protein